MTHRGMARAFRLDHPRTARGRAPLHATRRNRLVGRRINLVVALAVVGVLGAAATAVALVLAASATAGNSGSGTGGTSGPSTTTTTTFGVLGADPAYLSADEAIGIRLAMINVAWSSWEPTEAKMSSSYEQQIEGEVAEYRQVGWQVAVDIGLQTAPSWVMALPNGQLVDQSGVASGSPNYEFNAEVQSVAGAYIDSIVSALGSGVSEYRVGLGTDGEMVYPYAPTGSSGPGWWAFDALAQGRASGLPAGVGVSPMPGWTPGSSTWNGAAVTTAEVTAWYAWYSGALDDALTWEIDAYRLAGFTGTLQLVMPGDGAGPTLYDDELAARLAKEPYDAYFTMASGAVYWQMLDALPLAGTEIDISSVGDGSGDGGERDCQSTDQQVTLAKADPWISGWSDTRWLTYLAAKHGLAVMGENPGNTPDSELATIMGLVQSCHLTALQWAWDFQLNGSNTGYVTATQLGHAIAEFRSTAVTTAGHSPVTAPCVPPAQAVTGSLDCVGGRSVATLVLPDEWPSSGPSIRVGVV